MAAPVYLFTGFLDSGKTTLIMDTLNDKDFMQGVDRTLILCFEQGETEYTEEFLDECFELFGDRIKSCHIKDVHLKEEYTFRLEECAPGKGEFPLRYYAEKINEFFNGLIANGITNENQNHK